MTIAIPGTNSTLIIKKIMFSKNHSRNDAGTHRHPKKNLSYLSLQFWGLNGGYGMNTATGG
jgi:hypothetical protein